MIFLLIFSFFVEGILSLILTKESFLLPLFSIMSIFVSYPYIKNKKKFIIYSLLIGVLYDITFSQTLFLHTIVFLFISLLISIFNKYISTNFFNTLIQIIIIIIIFRSFIYIGFILSTNEVFSIKKLFESIYKSFIFNILYVYMVSYLLKRHFEKRKEKYKFK